jgi:hypothetical protein
MDGVEMNENELASTWATLEPTRGQRGRIDTRVRGWLDADESSLAAEWIDLIQVNPITSLGIAAVAACLMLLATPLTWMAYSLL